MVLINGKSWHEVCGMSEEKQSELCGVSPVLCATDTVLATSYDANKGTRAVEAELSKPLSCSAGTEGRSERLPLLLLQLADTVTTVTRRSGSMLLCTGTKDGKRSSRSYLLASTPTWKARTFFNEAQDKTHRTRKYFGNSCDGVNRAASAK